MAFEVYFRRIVDHVPMSRSIKLVEYHFAAMDHPGHFTGTQACI